MTTIVCSEPLTEATLPALLTRLPQVRNVHPKRCLPLLVCQFHSSLCVLSLTRSGSVLTRQAITVDLHACGLNDILLSRILPVLASQCPDLRDLDLSSNALTSAAMHDLVATVLSTDTLHLRRLNLSGASLKRDGLRTLLTGVAGHAFLEELDVSDTGADQDSLEFLFQALTVWPP